MAEPRAKYSKLQELRKSIPFTSKSSLAGIIGHIRAQGLPDGASSKDMRAANRQQLAAFNGYGPLLQEEELVMLEGGPMSLSFVNFRPLLHGAYKHCPGFHQLMKTTLDREVQPLHLMVYAGEITPGNVLSHAPNRKLWCIYGSFEEFKHHSLSENGWMTLCLLRSDIASKVDGHLSQILKILLVSIFCNNSCIADVGLQLQEPDGTPAPKRLRFNLGCFIMDGQAQKLAWSSKGDSGSRFCLLCSNVFQAQVSGEEEDELVSEVSKYCKHSDLCLNTNNDILAAWDRMSTGLPLAWQVLSLSFGSKLQASPGQVILSLHACSSGVSCCLLINFAMIGCMLYYQMECYQRAFSMCCSSLICGQLSRDTWSNGTFLML